MNIKEPGGQIDQMFRQTRAHHIELSKMADTKANMMMTVAALVIPLSVGHLSDPQLRLASLTAIAFCVATVSFAAYAAMPKLRVSKKTDEKPDPNSPTFNILFFADFIKMDYEEYKLRMEQILNDPSRTYEAQVREVYNIGLYLAHQKYRFVRLSYMTFITGLLVSAGVYIVQNVILG